ncbi:hypothetical protein WR25_23004 isoform B [Diploscapter pachys]|nr:hypothetical protein WR25_23004 isoform B [Diploscapter pachys]
MPVIGPYIDYEQDSRYYADRNRKQQDEVVEYWTPDEPRPVMPKIPLKTPKIKEPSANGKRSDTKPPTGYKRIFWHIALQVNKAKEQFKKLLDKAKFIRNKFRANKVAPIQSKVQTRHLELEPLCCLSSCLVRGGCTAVVIFELIYIAVTILFILAGMSRGGFTLWEPLPDSFNQWFGHHLFYYAIGCYDIILLVMALAMARGLLNFDKAILHAHFYFCFFSLFINIVFLVFSCFALSAPGPYNFTFLNCILIFCFAFQIPLQV